MDLDTLFGLWLKRRRKTLDLTQDALARRVGCSLATIQKIEADERRPSRQIADLLARALEIPPADRETFLKVARGERRVDRLPLLAFPAAPLPGQARLAARSNLPVPATPLVGREAELAALAELLRDPECRLVTLVGPGGIGKTRLAIEVAAAQLEAFGDGVCFVSRASLNSPEFIVPAAAALGFSAMARQAWLISSGSIAELVFGDATDLDPSHSMLHAHARSRQVAIVPFLTGPQLRVLGLFFGCRCSRTAGA